MRISKLRKTDNPVYTTPPPNSETSYSSSREDFVSLSLYLAGLCVSLAGLYAFNFNLEDANFAMLSYGLVITGYVLCYAMRRFHISARAAQIPLLIVVGLFCFSGISNGWFAPQVADDRAKSIELMLVYICIFHSFTLTTDTVVMFACVPVMALLSLTSTTSADIEIEYAFIFFISAATFLMVHENYLRTRMSVVRGRTPQKENKLFGGQFLLASLCVITALTLANVVAIPISEIGKRLPISTDASASSADKSKSSTSTKSNVRVTENSSIELSGGPESESNVELMRVRCDRGLFWRGDTYNDYNGQTFTHPKAPITPLAPEAPPADSDRARRMGGRTGLGGPLSNNDFQGSRSTQLYSIPLGSGEIPEEDMDKSRQSFQTITVVAGSFDKLYGAGVVQAVHGDIPDVSVTDSGSLSVKALPNNTSYDIVSRVADDDPDHLRKAPTRLNAFPLTIRQMYLQIPDVNPDITNLRNVAQEQTKNFKNNYDKVEALQHYIAQTCKYNLKVKAAPKDKDLVHYFLFEAKEGYCTQFAASLTMLCRYAGIPARLASGFMTGELDKDGTYIVREKHKHAWTEVFFPHIGWVPFESTDGAEDITDRTTHSKSAQTSFIGWLFSNGWIPPVIGLLIIGMLGYIIYTELLPRIRPRAGFKVHGNINLAPSNQAVVQSYTLALNALNKAGLNRSDEMTAKEYLRWIQNSTYAAIPELLASLQNLTYLHERYRYGQEIAGSEEMKQASVYAEDISDIMRKNRKTVAQLHSAAVQNPIPEPGV